MQQDDKRNRFTLLGDNLDALGVRVSLIRQARFCIDLQSYILRDGLTTRLIFQELLEAADRGVQIRLLLDDLTSIGQDGRLAALGCHDNINVRLFNAVTPSQRAPWRRIWQYLARFRELHSRMHNKALVVDGQWAITGGRNLADEYYGASDDVDFTDLDVLIQGPLASELGAAFEAYWRSPWALPVSRLRPFEPDREQQKLWRIRVRDRLRQAMQLRPNYRAQVIEWLQGQKSAALYASLRPASMSLWVDRPGKVAPEPSPDAGDVVFPHLLPLLQQAQQSLVLVSPYFIPGPQGVELLSELAARGVKITILTNSLASTDTPLVHGAYAQYRAALLEAGVALYEMRAHRTGRVTSRLRGRLSLHSKAMVLDERSIFVGSLNLDPRSFLWNTEVGVQVDSASAVNQLQHLIDEALTPERSTRLYLINGRLVFEDQGRKGLHRYLREHGSWWRKCLAWIGRFLAPQHLL